MLFFVLLYYNQVYHKPNMYNISVIQIIRMDNMDHKNVIIKNSQFLKSVGVEYIVYDTLEKFHVLKFIRDIPHVKYYRYENQNLTSAFAEAGTLALGKKIIYLKSDDILNMDNVEFLEKVRPNLYKDELHKISRIKTDNFKYDNFHILIKEDRNIFDYIKIFLSRTIA